MGAKRTKRSGIAVRDQIKAAAAQATSRRFVGHAMAVSEWLAYESELRVVAHATLLLALQRKRKAAHLRRGHGGSCRAEGESDGRTSFRISSTTPNDGLHTKTKLLRDGVESRRWVAKLHEAFRRAPLVGVELPALLEDHA